ncbi:MAG: AmmeMemoRadiSam system radical SAM enzyme [Defluviitaleaceae bacterium]|nr:AmmeMemoRadiSam system radical SAM enzyme [Defluviitaleaceae bacterium]
MSNRDAVKCTICPHFCLLHEGASGKCTVRKNINGQITSQSYGKITAIALDPIEKKPLYMFHSGSAILSIGSYGCNFRCPFCQNHEIAMPQGEIRTQSITPAELLKMAQNAQRQGNIGVAYTYNEPLINYEFILDCAKEIHSAGLKNILVTNGFINPEPLKTLLPYIDAMNIDLKAFTNDFYKKIGGSSESLDVVKNTIALAQDFCHVEVTTLLIPNENEDDIELIAKFLSELNQDIPLHISRFFPRNEFNNREATPHETIHRAVEIASKHLKNVFAGNI